ncbi:MAG: hypothetical protein SPLM_10720 [Spiroplasma phoeniceum]|uniref:lipoprotein n=1 Tax=Spiroplasma phoeniceum TaxID=47835 RepID=UPI003133DE8E
MKKILSFLGIFTLIGTSTTPLISCHDSRTYTKKVKDIGDWKGVSLPLNYFIKNNDNKYYVISHISSKNKKWVINLIYNNTTKYKFAMEPNYKVWQWTLENIPTLPNLDENGNIK